MLPVPWYRYRTVVRVYATVHIYRISGRAQSSTWLYRNVDLEEGAIDDDAVPVGGAFPVGVLIVTACAPPMARW